MREHRRKMLDFRNAALLDTLAAAVTLSGEAPMSNRIALLLICATAIGCAKEPKTADTKMAESKMADPKMAGCQSGNADSSVMACTILIDSTAGNDSSRAEALQLRGNAYRSKGDYDKAIQ